MNDACKLSPRTGLGNAHTHLTQAIRNVRLCTMANCPFRALTRRPVLWSLAALAVLIGAYSAAWLVLAERATAYVDAWATMQRARGYDVRWAAMDVGGYPFALDVQIERPSVRAEPAQSGWHWTTDRVRLHTRPWRWFDYDVMASATHRVAFADQVYALDAADLRGHVVIGARDWTRATLDVNAMALRRGQTSVAELVDGTLVVERFAAPAGPHTERTLRLETRLNGLSIAGLAASPLGPQIRYVGSVVEAFSRPPAALTSSALTRWRDDGGVLEVRKLDLRYGPLMLGANGTVALDMDLQPQAAFSARITGLFEAVDALHDAGVLRDGNVLTAKLVLGALGKRDEATGETSITLPLSIQDRTLHAGPLELGRVPRVVW